LKFSSFRNKLLPGADEEWTLTIKNKKGEKITRNNLDFKRPGNAGISVAEGYAILGKIASKDIPIDTFLQWDMLE